MNAIDKERKKLLKEMQIDSFKSKIDSRLMFMTEDLGIRKLQRYFAIKHNESITRFLEASQRIDTIDKEIHEKSIKELELKKAR